MKKFSLFLFTIFLFLSISCQRNYIESEKDIYTESIDFQKLTASCDSACMFDTIVIKAHAIGEDIQYHWEAPKGSLVPIKDDPSKVYFWGCQTCVGRLTIYCTVHNTHGSFTKNIDVFVWPWTKQQGRWNGWEKYIDKYGQW